MLNAKLEHNDNGDIHCKADVRHCFQNLPRAKVLQHLFTVDEFSDIFHLLHFLYGDESAMLLHMGRDKAAEIIRSLQGVVQGCVLGSMLCAVYSPTSTTRPLSRKHCAGMAAAQPTCWRSASQTN
jgi:hypothetical protein